MRIMRNTKDYEFTSEYGFELNKNSLILLKDDILIGFANIRIKDTELYLYEMEILKNFKNKGYGKTLITKLFEEFPDIKTIRGCSLEESRQFYHKIGARFLEPTCLNCNKCAFSNNKNDCDDYYDSYFLLERAI